MTTDLSTPQWGCFEQSFTSPTSYANPLQETALQVVFTSPSGQMRTVPGFWDGDTTWRVRFSPHELGLWAYTTRCSDKTNTGLHDQSGTFICVPSGGETRFERHGALRLSPNRRFLTHADGAPFFWLADTAWAGPIFSTDEEWAHYLQERVRQQFTAVQWMTTQTLSMPQGDPEGRLAFTGHDQIAVNPLFFQRLDAKIAQMNQAGLLSVPVLLWAAEWSTKEVNNLNPGLTLPEAQAILLARYMVARWGAYHTLWILPGDGLYTGPKAARWQRIGQAVFEDLPDALVTLHPSGMQWYGDDFQDESWLKLIGYQSCHFGDNQALSWIVAGPPAQKWPETSRPIINLEPCYEHHVDLANPDQRFDDYAVRRATYWSLLVSPTAGVSYGGHGVWGWDDGTEPPMNHPKTGTPLPWREALTMPAAEQMAYLAQLFNSIEWWRLRPAPELIPTQPGGAETPARYIVAARSEAGDLALIYTPEDRALEVRVEDLRPGLTAHWFNPRNGEQQALGVVPGQQTWALQTPAPGDWLLVLR